MATVPSSLPESITMSSEQKLNEVSVAEIVREAFFEIRIAVKSIGSRFIQKRIADMTMPT
jgi:hypothetical protein